MYLDERTFTENMRQPQQVYFFFGVSLDHPDFNANAATTGWESATLRSTTAQMPR